MQYRTLSASFSMKSKQTWPDMGCAAQHFCTHFRICAHTVQADQLSTAHLQIAVLWWHPLAASVSQAAPPDGADVSLSCKVPTGILLVHHKHQREAGMAAEQVQGRLLTCRTQSASEHK
jgi:hypothetical protein